MNVKSSVILIGMPGAGKSTVGVLLAKYMAKAFVDTDILIQEALGETLQSYLDREGYLALREKEEEILAKACFDHHVIATGGSAVYSETGMSALTQVGVVVYLSISHSTVKQRVSNQSTRGIASQPGSSLDDIYQERLSLYNKYAQITVVADGLTPDLVAQEVMEKIKSIRAE
ncbi:shikimate kinase [Teredinibacter sp. KSP-S5-2]|nr:shikimate kinase [Teredinibacter sp. KSP-S5-2]